MVSWIIYPSTYEGIFMAQTSGSSGKASFHLPLSRMGGAGLPSELERKLSTVLSDPVCQLDRINHPFKNLAIRSLTNNW